MTSEFNELLSVPPAEKVQVWIIGDRDQVAHLINEFYVKRIATDRVQFTPIFPVPFADGKYMSVLVR
jgi:alkanesulfonate monooxygenase SsuD/methylene tetrahydromethanopterin reductase-like flavin-dependent oxidoreductase (luciferase family)